jgi:hypothetical protein
MTLNITRREALQIAIAGALAQTLLPRPELPESPESEFVDVDDFTPEPYGEPIDWTPAQVAPVIAAMELGSQQHNRPEKWRSLRYDGAIQWGNGDDGRLPKIAWYGIGPAEWTATRLPELLAWIRNCECLQSCADEYGWDNVLGHARIARGRAFGIVSVGTLSQRLRYELRKPAWKRDRTICV